MGSATIGALHVVLGLDSAEFTKGLQQAQAQLRRASRQFKAAGDQMASIGKTLSLSITAPLAAMGVAVVRTAADFESSMTKVGISTKATAREMVALQAEARKIGKDTVFSATEAADAMDLLAKTGLNATTILGGAARATVDLAAAAGSGLEPAAAAIADTLQQFKLSTAELPSIVNQITGAVNESKLSFDDYSLAIGQAGGVAAGLGVDFDDFNTVLAATSANFASGSDAGTSFKTFLQRLVPQSKDAAAAMAQYGLSFFDANGQMKSMSAIAELLREKLGGLSDEAKTNVLTEVFGTDAMRTALGLMDQGAAGLDRVAAAIRSTDAAAQAAKRMEGFNGQLQQLKGSLEELAIVIGESGLLNALTGIVTGLSGLVDRMSEADPALVKMSVTFAAVAAAIGPMVIVIGSAITAVGTILGLLSAPITLPIVVGVAAAAAAFAVFGDEIIPALKSFGQALVDTIGPKLTPLFDALSGAVSSLAGVFDGAMGGDGRLSLALITFGEIIARVFGASIDLLTGALNVVSEIFQTLAAVLRGDLTGAFEHFGGIAIALAKGLSNAFRTLFPEVVASVKALYEGVAKWLGGGLARVMDSVRQKARDVGDAFFQLYDRVVGHSYVPDMVEGVAAWMRKLDAGMVKPAKAATTKTAAEFEKLRDRAADLFDRLLTPGERATLDLDRDLKDLGALLRAGVIDATQFADAWDRLTVTGSKFEQVTVGLAEGLRDTVDALDDAADGMKGARTHAERLADSFGEVRFAFDDIVRSIKQGDIGALLQNVQGLANGIGGLLSQGAAGALSLGSLAANVIGGKTGRAIGGGLGIAASGVGLGAFAGTLTGGAALTAAGLGAAVGPLIALAGPLGIAAGALYAAAKIFNIGGKPSNKGAGVSLVTGEITGKSRDAETEKAAVAAADAIKAGQDALKDAGITLGATVHGLVIGTRDLSQVYLTNGKTVTAAVGDAAAAVDAGLRSVLDSATYASDAQRKVAESALAAGKGFDGVLEALGQYKAAQSITDILADEILRLTDPKAYDTKAVRAEIDDQRKAAKAAADAGYLTADQLATINAQLNTLQGLRLDEVLGRYGDSVQGADDLAGAVEDASDDLIEVYEGQISAAEDVRDAFAGVADSLGAFDRELSTSALGGLSPAQQLAAAQKAFDAVKNGTDAESLAKIPELGRALIEAQRAVAPDARTLAATQAEVLRATRDGQAIALDQVSAAEQQIAALRGMIDRLQTSNDLALTQIQAETNLAAAIAAQTQALQAASAAMAAAGQAAAAAAAGMAAAATNDNGPLNVGGFDAASAAAAMTGQATTAALQAVSSDPDGPMVAALEAALGPYLRPMVKATVKTAELNQLARDEADAA